MAKYRRILVFIFLLFVNSGSLLGQCPGSDSLLQAITLLREDSGLPPRQQVTVLSQYEARVAGCSDHDSVHVRYFQRMGQLFYLISDYSKAINYYNRSIQLIKEYATRPSINLKDLIPAYYWVSVCNDSLRRVTDKIKALDSSAAIAIRLKSIDAYCLWALYNRAEYSFDIGDYQRCIDYASLCESLATKFSGAGSKHAFDYGTQYAISSLVWNINALIALKKYEDAEILLKRKAIECSKKKLEHNLGAIYALLAEVLELKGEYGQVLYYQNQALAIEKRSGESINCKAILNDIGYEVWFRHYKNTDKALEYYTRALKYKVDESQYRVLNSLESLRILNRIANVYVLRGNYEEAFRYIQLAFDQIKPGISEVDVLQRPLDEFIGLRRIGYVAALIEDKAIAFQQKYKAIGNVSDIKEAVRIHKVADQFLERIKTEQSDVKSKLFWRSDRRRLYELAIEACYAYGNTADAFYFFERSRAVLLNDELSELHLMTKGDMIRQEQLKRSITQLNQKLTLEDKSSDLSRTLQEEIMKDRQELDALSKLVNARNPLYYQGFSEADYGLLTNVQTKLLKGDDKLLEFFDGDSAIYCIILSTKKVFLERINKASFENSVNRFVSYVSDGPRLNKNFGDFADISYRLYQMIFPNISSSSGKIIICLDGHYFPLEALISNKTTPISYLIEAHPVSYVHSARSLMIDFNSETNKDAKSFLGMAPVNFPAMSNMPSLAGSNLSLETLGSKFRNSNCLAFASASKNNFMREFPAYKIIQLYTHASDNGNAGEPEIYFADSVLYLSELMNERKPFTKLIVLSACETGTGQWYQGEGVFSFNRGFAALGVPSSVTNLWSVENVSSYRLTGLFYKYIKLGLPIDVALQKAKLEFIRSSTKEKSLPYYWAATILAGKTDAIEQKKTFPRKAIILLTILGGGLFFLTYMLWIKH